MGDGGQSNNRVIAITFHNCHNSFHFDYFFPKIFKIADLLTFSKIVEIADLQACNASHCAMAPSPLGLHPRVGRGTMIGRLWGSGSQTISCQGPTN